MEVYLKIKAVLTMEPGDVNKLELIALEADIRREILDFIGFELKKLEEIGKELGVEDKELSEHIDKLEKALLLEKDGECYKLTPRCVAYLDGCEGYEWVR
jgi:predicted transcriptional regulator